MILISYAQAILPFAYHFGPLFAFFELVAQPKNQTINQQNALLHPITGLDSNLEAFNSHLMA